MTGERWVCPLCGKHAEERTKLGDEACVTKAILCTESSLTYREDGRVATGAAVARLRETE